MGFPSRARLSTIVFASRTPARTVRRGRVDEPLPTDNGRSPQRRVARAPGAPRSVAYDHRSLRQRRDRMAQTETSDTSDKAVEPGSGSKYLALTAMVFAVAMTFIDQTIVSI